MNGYLEPNQISEIGFKHIGVGCLISDKACFYQPELIEIGNNVRIDDFCIIIGNVKIGNCVHIAPYVSIHGTGGGSVNIYDFCALSGYVAIYSSTDDFVKSGLCGNVPLRYHNILCSDIVLEEHCVVGLKAILCTGAYMRTGSTLGAMSLLKNQTQEWSVYAGVPSRKIRDRERWAIQKKKEFLNEENLKG